MSFCEFPQVWQQSLRCGIHIWFLSPLVPSKQEKNISVCIFFEGSVFPFQFLNNEIYNYVKKTLIVNFWMIKLKSKHTSLKKYTNWAKLTYFSLVLREREEKNKQIFRSLVPRLNLKIWPMLMIMPNQITWNCQEKPVWKERNILRKQKMLFSVTTVPNFSITKVIWNIILINSTLMK